MFWYAYLALVRLGIEIYFTKRRDGTSASLELVTFKRALRSVPGSGEVWARYLRFLVCIADCFQKYEFSESYRNANIPKKRSKK
jgi:hypothetical protein